MNFLQRAARRLADAVQPNVTTPLPRVGDRDLSYGVHPAPAGGASTITSSPDPHVQAADDGRLLSERSCR